MHPSFCRAMVRGCFEEKERSRGEEGSTPSSPLDFRSLMRAAEPPDTVKNVIFGFARLHHLGLTEKSFTAASSVR